MWTNSSINERLPKATLNVKKVGTFLRPKKNTKDFCIWEKTLYEIYEKNRFDAQQLL